MIHQQGQHDIGGLFSALGASLPIHDLPQEFPEILTEAPAGTCSLEQFFFFLRFGLLSKLLDQARNFCAVVCAFGEQGFNILEGANPDLYGEPEVGLTMKESLLGHLQLGLECAANVVLLLQSLTCSIQPVTLAPLAGIHSNLLHPGAQCLNDGSVCQPRRVLHPPPISYC